MYDLLIKFPTRSRPDKFRNQFDRCYNMLSGKYNVKFVVSMDLDDNTMNNDDMKWWLSPANGGRKNIDFFYGNSKSKVQAINANMENQSAKAYLLMSDDMTVMEKNYDEIIMQDFGDNFNQALWYYDGRRRDLNTLSLMGDPVFQKIGRKFYCPHYTSLWVDNEYHELMQRWGVLKFIDRVIIKHEWTDYTGPDPLHRRNESFYHKDKIVYDRRKIQGFPTPY